MSSFMLSEHSSFDQAKMMVESEIGEQGKPKKLYMKGIFIQGDVKNHNQRVYPMHEIRKAVDDVNAKIAQGFTICGEADHPKELEINMDRISHKILEMHVDGKNGNGKLQILNTPMGNLARTLIEDEVKLGVSSRGYGDLESNGYVSNYVIVTVDLVCNPSAPNSYPVPIWESLNMPKRGAIIDDLSRSMVHDAKAQAYLQKELLEFINKLG